MKLLAKVFNGVCIFSSFTKSLFSASNCGYREHIKTSAIRLTESSVTFAIFALLMLHSEYWTWKQESSEEKKSLPCMKLTVSR